MTFLIKFKIKAFNENTLQQHKIRFYYWT